MADGPERVTAPLLDVLEVLVEAHAKSNKTHGWAILKASGRSGPTVYGVLERLEGYGWLEAEWEAAEPVPGKPRRRFYTLTAYGAREAATLLASQRSKRTVQAPKPRGIRWAIRTVNA